MAVLEPISAARGPVAHPEGRPLCESPHSPGGRHQHCYGWRARRSSASEYWTINAADFSGVNRPRS